MIPLSIPNFEGNEEKYVLDAVSQGWVSTGGAYVERFEQQITEYTGTVGAVACQSGTAGLHLALLECGVGQGDAVIVPTLTFIAAVNPVKYVCADPIFMDCDDSLCLDPNKFRLFCEEECEVLDGVLFYKSTGQKIKAAIIVHVFGNLADMEQIMDIAKEYHLRIIEDATEALGSYYEKGCYAERMAGSIGEFGVYSFNGNKIITTGGGGMVVSQNKKSLNHLKYISTQAKDDALLYLHNEIGYNYRMTNVQAAIGVAQLEMLEEFIKRKNENYLLYEKLLEPGRLLPFREGVRSNRWFYSYVINKDIDQKNVSECIEYLNNNEIQVRPIWGLIHNQIPYQKCISYKIEKADYFSERVINLPCSTNITKESIVKICRLLS